MNYGECEVREDFVCVSFMFLYFLMKNTENVINGNDLIGKYWGCKREKKKIAKEENHCDGKE